MSNFVHKYIVMPHADASNPMANRYKYGSKEFYADLGLNTSDFEARYFTPAFPSFNQPDPLAESKPWNSPYLYCAANPIMYIDPSGMNEYQIDENGKIVNTIITTDYDAIAFVDKDGKVIAGATVMMDYGTIVNVEVNDKKDDPSVSLTLNESVEGDAQFAFEQCAVHTGVEWSILYLHHEDEGDSHVISNSHSATEESGWRDKLNRDVMPNRDKYTLSRFDHSHPANTPYPSGLMGEGYGDIYVVGELWEKGFLNVQSNIFCPDGRRYIQYDRNSKLPDFINTN